MENPISELITDSDFNKLNNLGFIDKKNLRDYQIRRDFYKMRDEKIKPAAILKRLVSLYPYLREDTIRKIAYDKK